MIFTTFAVVVLPVLIVTLLRTEQIVEGIVPLLFAGLGISIAISSLGAAIWKTRPGSGDLLFGDLIVWGFVRRWLVDRRLSSATKILGQRDEGGDELSPAEKVELLEKLSSALEARDPYTHGHSRRVARHSTTMAKQMGLSKEQVAKIRTAAAIHDVGKVDTPREVLGKEGKLTDDEYEVIKEHPVVGAKMASDLKDTELTEMVRHHHERLDGRGYPDGLRGDGIPLGARIIAVADTFDAITSARPYRPATAHKKALDVLQSESGSQLDPDVVEAFRSYYSGFRPVAIWAVIANLPQRLFAGIFDELGAGVASASKAMATTAAVVVGAASAQTVDFAPASHNAGTSAAERALASTVFPGPVLGSLPGARGLEASPGRPDGKPSPGPNHAKATTPASGPLASETPDYAAPAAAPFAGGPQASEASSDPEDRGPKSEAPAQESEADQPARGEEPTRDDGTRADSGSNSGDDTAEQPADTGDRGNSGENSGGNSGNSDGGNSGSGGNPGKGGGPTGVGNPGKGGGPGNGAGPPGGSPPGQSGSPGNSGAAPGGGPPSGTPAAGGSPGNSGSSGSGSPGNSGSSGSSGSSGNSGSSGSSAAPGSSGSSGSSAAPGNSGSSGGPPPGAGKHGI